jgi:acylpyruvate hydrolase
MDPGDTYAFVSVLAIDMTARNIQDQVKKKGLPWSAAKGFDTFTPVRHVQCLSLHVYVRLIIACSSFIPKDAIRDPHNTNLWLKVNFIRDLWLSSYRNHVRRSTRPLNKTETPRT